MKLHEDKRLFTDIITKGAIEQAKGGLGIKPQFIEKDYWICNSLRYLSESPYVDYAVFKGGTSLSKAHHIIQRFSEDIDVAIIINEGWSDSKLKSIIRSTEKSMSKGLTEINHKQSSKGSRYRKTFYSYPMVNDSRHYVSFISGQILLEINSFANPFPFNKIQINSFIYDYLSLNNRNDLIEEFGLKPFYVNVLDKKTTLTEKLVSLIRFSLSQNPKMELEAKIRHFYDLHCLLQDCECLEYINSEKFGINFCELMKHDREIFEKPSGWQRKEIKDSPLLIDFGTIWSELKKRYETELPLLTYSLAIPKADKIETSINKIIEIVKDFNYSL